MDGNIGPPPGGPPPPGGGAQRRVPSFRRGLAPYELWSSDEETGIRVGLGCVHDACKGVFYAKFWAPLGGDRDEGSSSGVDAERSTKGAITTLLDVAEACRCRKITIGLGVEDAASAELVCSLLYLGFQVVPPRRSPLEGTALLLDFDIGLPAWQGGPVSSDYTCTDTFDCSTSADESCSCSPNRSTDSS